MIDRDSKLSISRQADFAQYQPGHRLLFAKTRLGA